LYDAESRGRWNDGKSARQVSIVFNEPLPARFRLEITALAWGRSVGAPVRVVFGTTATEMVFGHVLSTQSVIMTNSAANNQLILIPPFRERASDQDYRYLSFLLNQMTITPLP
jgi:phosphoglycerol transferase